MPWLSNPGAAMAASSAAARQTFDVPIKMRVRGMAEPVQATLLHIAVSGARLRSWMHLDRGASLSFEWRLSDGKLLTLTGTVAARYAPRNGGVGFEYAIALSEPGPDEADALSREAAMLVRSTASARSYDTSVVDISQFTGYRVPDDFAIAYRADVAGAVPKVARACDVSGNGLRLRCDGRMRAGEVLVLQFTLPDNVLHVHKGKDDDVVVGPFGYRRVTRKYLRRPFGQLKLKARVLGTVKDARRRDAYELQFLDVDGAAREELARYIHASQLASVKRS